MEKNELVEMKIEGTRLTRRKALTFIEIVAALGIAAVIGLGVYAIAKYVMKQTDKNTGVLLDQGGTQSNEFSKDRTGTGN